MGCKATAGIQDESHDIQRSKVEIAVAGADLPEMLITAGLVHSDGNDIDKLVCFYSSSSLADTGMLGHDNCRCRNKDPARN